MSPDLCSENISAEEMIKLFQTREFDKLASLGSDLNFIEKASANQLNVLGVVFSELEQFDRSINCFKQASEREHVTAEIYNNFACTLLKVGKLFEAKKCLNQALEIDPTFAEALNTFGNYHLKRGDVVNARECYQKSLHSKPDYFDALHNLTHLDLKNNAAKDALKRIQNVEIDALFHHKVRHLESNCYSILGFHRKALELLNSIENADPNDYHILSDKASLLHTLKRYSEAIEIYNKLLQSGFNDFPTLMNLALSQGLSGNTNSALKNFQTAFNLKPDDAKLLNNYGIFMQHLGRFDDAERAFNKALSIDPTFAAPLNNIGNLLYKSSKYFDALEFFYKSLQLNETQPEVYNNVGNTFIKLDEPGKAVKEFNKALKMRPDYPEALNHRSVAYTNLGDFEKAIDDLNKVLTIAPEYAQAHKNLTRCKKYDGSEQQIKEIETLLGSDAISRLDRVNLLYALSKMQSDYGDYKSSFENMQTAGDLYKQHINYNFENDVALFEQLSSTARNASSLEPLATSDRGGAPIPIFILGMPRSGTTLVEQIISSHHEVSGLGELPYATQWFGELAIGQTDLNYDNIAFARDGYLKAVTKHSVKTDFFTDKMPHNFRMLHLIRLALPEAKIIHVNRDPAATCWSNFSHFFPTDTLGYNCTLNDCVEYYSLYQQFMSHILSLSNHTINTVDYDSLVGHQENVSRNLIKFCGLNWDPTCLRPEANKRSVRTASSTQIRSSVYKGSSEKWKKYASYLPNLKYFST